MYQRTEADIAYAKQLWERDKQNLLATCERNGHVVVVVGSNSVRYRFTKEQIIEIYDTPIRTRHRVVEAAVRAYSASVGEAREDTIKRIRKIRSHSECYAYTGYSHVTIPILQRIKHTPMAPITIEERLRQKWLQADNLPYGLFGIEIEFANEKIVEEREVEYGAGVCDLGPECCPPVGPTYLKKINVTLPVARYRDILIPGVSFKTDSSVSPRHSDSQEANLLVGPNGFKRLVKLCKEIKDRRGFINDTCGLHVHLDARMDDRRVAGIRASKLWDAMPILKELVPDSRLNNNRYCMLEKPSFGSGRYKAINLESYGTHSTIEVRLGAGSLNPGKIWHWANLLFLISRSRQRFTSWEAFLKSDLPLNLRIWAVGRANELRPNEELRLKRINTIAPGLDDVLKVEYGKEKQDV